MTLWGNPRRKLKWDRLHGARERIALLVATSGGAGLAPFAPGLFGTLVGVPVHFFTAGWDWPYRLVLWSALFCAGVWAAQIVDEVMGTSDNQNIVMDETVGYGITAWTAGTDPLAMGVAFVVFRAFDMIKPPPVSWIDQWSHRRAKTHGEGHGWMGFGDMADDAAAGLLSLLVVLAVQKLGWI